MNNATAAFVNKTLEVRPLRMQLGAVRVGSQYAFPIRLCNPTPFMRRWRIREAGWHDDPALAKASFMSRFKVLPLAPGISATITVLFAAKTAGNLRGHIVIHSDDDCLITVAFSALAVPPADFDQLRQDAVAYENGAAVVEAFAFQAEREMEQRNEANYRRGGEYDESDELSAPASLVSSARSGMLARTSGITATHAVRSVGLQNEANSDLLGRLPQAVFASLDGGLLFKGSLIRSGFANGQDGADAEDDPALLALPTPHLAEAILCDPGIIPHGGTSRSLVPLSAIVAVGVMS
jgi:hypothetical protein